MIFEINGINFLPYIAAKGIKWQRNDLDSDNSGRTLDGTMHRGRVATKIRMDITCIPLSSPAAKTVLNAIYPETVTVHYTDPQYGELYKTMYSNNNPAALMRIQEDGTELWEGIEFPLIEI